MAVTRTERRDFPGNRPLLAVASPGENRRDVPGVAVARRQSRTAADNERECLQL
ncbi:hypothetical protein [Halapricum desulfuricans]|uniref:hypothetical protein n=1 Tax=Halapricum desulfuricans TaxID=2841257 RepID=UPI001E4EAE4F|nr:hypothetical protein [Halapricum desulfuricans]